ncbi:MAG: alpha/beta hydrolase [Chloroflexota bacterium]|nr:alpha/beta hydrolase [Chloroflexota bacterium]
MARLAQVATARQAQLQDGRRLGFAQFGDADGKAIIFFHDLWGNRNIRHPDDSILARLGIRLIGVDRPGYGMSTRKSGRSLMDVVDDVMLLSKALKLEQFSVLGFSAGGPYALACAYRFPQIVTRCAVVAPLPPLDHERGFRALHPAYGRMFQLAGGNESFFRLLMRGFFWFDGQRGPDQFIKELGGLMSSADQEVLGNINLFNSRRDIWGEIRSGGSDKLADEMVTLTKPWGFRLQSIGVPVDIWWGEADVFCAPGVGQRMAAMIPQAQFRLEPQAGHFMLFSHWQAILQTLAAS